MRGTVTMVTRNASFGFLRPDGRREDIFFAGDAIVDDADVERIAQYDRVEFDTAPDLKKPDRLMAVNVRLLNEADAS